MRTSSPLIQHFRKHINCDVESPSPQTELIRPSFLSPALRKSAVYLKARALATQLFEEKAHYQFDHAIYKDSIGSEAIPWHQDQAYSGLKSGPKGLHFWIPFQDSGPDNGGMIFIEESFQALLAHTPLKPGSRTLILNRPAFGKTRCARVSRGGLSVHHNFTVHASGANHTDRPRKAWILHFYRTTLLWKYYSRFRASIPPWRSPP